MNYRCYTDFSNPPSTPVKISKQPPHALSGVHIPEWGLFTCPAPQQNALALSSNWCDNKYSLVFAVALTDECLCVSARIETKAAALAVIMRSRCARGPCAGVLSLAYWHVLPVTPGNKTFQSSTRRWAPEQVGRGAYSRSWHSFAKTKSQPSCSPRMPRSSPLIHVLSGTFSTSYFAFQICPAALHPGKTEQTAQEQTINCDLFYSIHLIRNRLCILVRLSGELLGLVCIYQGLPIA